MDPEWRTKADYSGPPESWPPASTVLLAFGEALKLELLPPPDFERAVHLLSLVWNAVVLADVEGDDKTLAEVRDRISTSGSSDPFTERLIPLKRAEYAQDTRLFLVHEVHWAGGQANLRVQWRDARGG